MQKDFDQWNQLKKQLNAGKRLPFKEREVWWCSIGENVGDEANGKGVLHQRPVLILRKFNRHIFYGVPLTTQVKENPYYLKIHFKGRAQCVVLSQIRLLDAKRLVDRMGSLSPTHYETVRNASGKMFTAP